MLPPSRIFYFFFSPRAKSLFERYVIHLAIAGYMLHISYFLVHGLRTGLPSTQIFQNILVALYTPFSLILIFEVYLLVYYLPRSTTEYIAKEFEIIALIMIRRIFYDLGHINISPLWFRDKEDLTFTVDLLATLAVFTLIWLFYSTLKNIRKCSRPPQPDKQIQLDRFIITKQRIAGILLIIFGAMLLYSIGESAYYSLIEGQAFTVKYLSAIFFEDFFTVLIISDVFILLISHYHTHDFHRLMRNSGYIVSTVLIRLSFTAEGIVSSLLITFAVAFSLIISWIYLQYEKQGFRQE
ncbi:MAG: hypothetical protein ACP5O2_09220 [Bacteroidales bacterium]